MKTLTFTGNATLAGVLLALGAGFFYSLNDLAIKFLSSTYPLHQIVLIRSFISLAVVLFMVRTLTGGFSVLATRRPWLHTLRMMVVFCSNVTYFLGLAALPLADAVVLGYTSPVFVTLLSIWFLKERVGVYRWAAVITALAGTVIMARPGGEGGIQPAMFFILFSALSYATSQLMVRGMRETENAYNMSFWMQIGFICTSSLTGLLIGHGEFNVFEDASLTFLLRSWITPSVSDLPIFLMMGLAIGLGSLMMTQAYRLLQAAVAAPFEYLSVLMAVFWGFVVFGSFPDVIGFVGITMIVGSGLFTLWRETVRGTQH